MINLTNIAGFQWDDGNARKNEKHGVSTAESEQVFFNAPLLMLEDAKHSVSEPRFHALGKTDVYKRQILNTSTSTTAFTKACGRTIDAAMAKSCRPGM